MAVEEKLANFRQIDLAIAREREKENGPEARAEAMLRHSGDWSKLAELLAAARSNTDYLDRSLSTVTILTPTTSHTILPSRITFARMIDPLANPVASFPTVTPRILRLLLAPSVCCNGLENGKWR